MLCGSYDIGGLEVGSGLVQRQKIAGINVVIAGTKYSNKQSFFKRVTSFLMFMFFSIYAGLRTGNVDVIYATSTPLTIGIPAMFLKWCKHIPYIFEVRDQWPQLPIELGIIKNKIICRLLLGLEKTIYKQSAAIIALSPDMAEGVRKVIGHKKSVTVIPNSCDTDVFSPDAVGSAIRKEQGWGSKFVLLHFGAIGKANGLEFVIDVAERLKSNTNIHFVLVGDGGEKASLVKIIVRGGLKNIEFLDSVPKTELPRIIAACDVSMVIFADYPILQHNSANKFFDSLSAGKPVLLNYSGWQREVLEQNNAGFGCKQYDVDEFVEKVLYLNSHGDELSEMGRNARKLAKNEFNRDILAQKALDNILKCLGKG
jgi:glycosyltransferase involved in cell wall biosynthesis